MRERIRTWRVCLVASLVKSFPFLVSEYGCELLSKSTQCFISWSPSLASLARVWMAFFTGLARIQELERERKKKKKKKEKRKEKKEEKKRERRTRREEGQS